MFSAKNMFEIEKSSLEQHKIREASSPEKLPAKAAGHIRTELQSESAAKRSLERACVERRKEQVISSLVFRLYENGFTQENWERLAKPERLSELQKVSGLMAQEMLLPPELSRILHEELVRKFDEGLFDFDDVSRVYAKLYSAVKDILESDSEIILKDSGAYASAKAALSQLEIDSFAEAYREGAVSFCGGLSASQGLRMTAEQNLSRAESLRRSAASMMREAGTERQLVNRSRNLQNHASSAMAQAARLEQEGRRLMRMYNAEVSNAHRKK